MKEKALKQRSPKLQDFAIGVNDLPTIPDLAAQLLRKTADPQARAEDVRRIISQDPALAARVLKLANSSFYARSKEIKTLTHAIVIVGFNSVKSMVMASVTRGLHRSFGATGRLLWRHSWGAAVAAKVIGQHVGYDELEEAFLAGLLHDIGKVVLLAKAPSTMERIVEVAKDHTGGDFCILEKRCFGFDHTRVGHLVVRNWRFSQDFEEAIGMHHDPGKAKVVPELVHLTRLASMFCHKLGMGVVHRPELDLATDLSSVFFQLSKEDVEALAEEIQDVAQSNVKDVFR